MKLFSYLRKFFLLIAIKTIYKKNHLTATLYMFNLPSLDHIRKVAFVFNNEQYMHLGDHLFFIPLIKAFMDSGYNVIAVVTKPMQELFAKLGIPVAKTEINYNEYDLIISRFELIPEFKRFASVLVHVSQNLTMPICSQLLLEFGTYFKLAKYRAIDYAKICNPDILQQLQLPVNNRFIIFNPYCDASSYLVNDTKLAKIYNKLNELLIKFPAAKVILTGSCGDKEGDSNFYPFDYIDLRGKTTIVDIFSLVNCACIINYVGFDSFTMHVFSLLKKPSFALFRGRITNKQNDMLKRYHVNLFENDDFVKLI